MDRDRNSSKRRILPLWASLALTVGLLALVCAFTLAAARAAPPARPEAPTVPRPDGNYGGNFRFAVMEPDSLDPIDVDFSNNQQASIVRQIFQGLVQWDDQLFPRMALARSWISGDAQNWTFQLRRDVRFHNGRPLTAQDVVYSWQRLASASNEWYDYALAPLLDSYTAVGTDTLQVTLNEPFAMFPTLLALPFMSVVPSETVGTIVTQPVGSGPFQFQSWTPGDSVVLTHYDEYYGGRPYLDSITFQFYPDEAAMYDDYLLGNLDLSPVPTEHIGDVVGNPNALFVTQLRMSALWMKVDWAPFDDVRVRQALNYAIDKQDLVDNVLTDFGYYVVAEGPVPPGMQAYNPAVPNYPYNPTLALDLLGQAGWSDTNDDGILDDGTGTDLTLELWYGQRTPEDGPVVDAIADDLRDIGPTGVGATVIVSSTDWSTYFSNLDTYPFYRLGWGADFPDPYNFLFPLFHSAGWYASHTHYQSAWVDDFLDEARATPDRRGRESLYRYTEFLIQEEGPAISLYYNGAVYVQSDDVIGLVIPAWGTDGIQMHRVQLFFDTHDVEPQSILYPKESVLVGPIAPAVKVRNAGSSAEANIPVRCRILEGSTELYNQTLTIAALSPFATQVVAFPAWTPPAAGNYTFEFTTQLPVDENPANDQETLAVHVTDVAFYDAYNRDNPTDSGSVPTTAWWQSPDILVRHRDDNVRRHQDPILGQTNYAYVQVRNIGNDTLTDAYVDVYWHEPATAVICGDWAFINPAPIPVGMLAPGEGAWVVTPWLPTVEGHTCLFSRLWSSDDPVTFECDVHWDNNIAQRNVEVVDLDGGGLRGTMQTGQASVLFEVINVRDLPAAVDLVVERGTFPATGALELEFSRDLFTRWQDAGGVVVGGAAIPDTTRIEVTDPVSATVVGLPLGVREVQQAWMHLDGPAGVEFALHVTERIEGTLVGGMTYQTEAPWYTHLPIVLRAYSP